MAEVDNEADNGPDSNIEVVWTTPGTRASQDKKRTRASHKVASSSGTGTKRRQWLHPLLFRHYRPIWPITSTSTLKRLSFNEGTCWEANNGWKRSESAKSGLVQCVGTSEKHGVYGDGHFSRKIKWKSCSWVLSKFDWWVCQNWEPCLWVRYI